MVWELRTSNVQAGFRKGRGTRDQIANISCWIIEKASEFQGRGEETRFINQAKIFVWITTNCGKFLKRWEYQITLPVSWETCTWVKKQQLEMGWFKIGKRVCWGSILSLCLFNFYAEYIIWSVRLDESQVGIKTARRNIKNLRYTDETTLMAESEDEPKRLDEGERGEWKSWLKTQHSTN